MNTNPQSPTAPTTAGRDVDAEIAVNVMKWKRMTWRERWGYSADEELNESFDRLTDYWHDSEGKDVAPIDQECDCGQSHSNWSPSTDISAAMEVADKLNASSIQFVRTRNDDWACFITLPVTGASERFYAEAQTHPMALCLAALKAVGGRGNNL